MSGQTVLLIEDDQWFAETLTKTLHEYEVEIASNAQTAVELLDDKNFDAIVADVMLENGLVIDLLHELQSYADTSLIPVVLCTSLAGAVNLEDVRQYGVVAVLDKATTTPSDIRVAVQRAIHERDI